jgi:hypothetical protein
MTCHRRFSESVSAGLQMPGIVYKLAIELNGEAIVMADTSVDVDTELLRSAKEVFGVRTNREAIALALEESVRRRRQLEAIKVIAGLDLELDPQGPDPSIFINPRFAGLEK